MKCVIIAIGKISSRDPEDQIIREYLKRIPWQVEIKQLEADHSAKKTAEKLLAAIPKGYYPILLDKDGKNYSSEEFAHFLENSPSNTAFLIGGAEGFHKDIYDHIKTSISLGKMTYAHKLARVVLVEQIYRAWTIATRHPYHK
jgi:23S rRNA (pseudouridine1915-N3)-methyltransferase